MQELSLHNSIMMNLDSLIHRYMEIIYQPVDMGEMVLWYPKGYNFDDFDFDDAKRTHFMYDDEIEDILSIGIFSHDLEIMYASFSNKEQLFEWAYNKLYEYRSWLFSSKDDINKELAAFVWELEKEIKITA